MKARLVNESLEDILKGPSEEEIKKGLKAYAETEYNMNKFIPEDLIEEFYEIIDSEENEEIKINDMESFLCGADDRMYDYFPEGGNIIEFATYLIKNG